MAAGAGDGAEVYVVGLDQYHERALMGMVAVLCSCLGTGWWPSVCPSQSSIMSTIKHKSES